MISSLKREEVVVLEKKDSSYLLSWGSGEKRHTQSFTQEAAERHFGDLVKNLQDSGKKVEVEDGENGRRVAFVTD